jgi:daunosaminyl-N,N-dimethyltransferase/N-dimethyltransferase
MQNHGMYGDRAELYDVLYSFKDYAAEAAQIQHRLHDLGVVPGARVLEAACGTGEHLRHLAQTYAVDGFDLADGMLRVARSKLPGAHLFQADMAELTVAEPYDAVLCLFSSIGYVFPQDRLEQTALRFFSAMRPGGVALVEPWLRPEDFVPGRPTIQTGSADGLEVCRAVVGRLKGELSVFDFHWLIARRNATSVEHIVERHQLWLCPHDVLHRSFEGAGFECDFDDKGLTGRGLLIARRPS